MWQAKPRANYFQQTVNQKVPQRDAQFIPQYQSQSSRYPWNAWVGRPLGRPRRSSQWYRSTKLPVSLSVPSLEGLCPTEDARRVVQGLHQKHSQLFIISWVVRMWFRLEVLLINSKIIIGWVKYACTRPFLSGWWYQSRLWPYCQAFCVTNAPYSTKKPTAIAMAVKRKDLVDQNIRATEKRILCRTALVLSYAQWATLINTGRCIPDCWWKREPVHPETYDRRMAAIYCVTKGVKTAVDNIKLPTSVERFPSSD